MKDYGERLKQARLDKGYTQKQIATILEYPQPYYQRIESGKYNLQMSTIVKLCRALDISSDWLLGLTPDKVKANGPEAQNK